MRWIPGIICLLWPSLALAGEEGGASLFPAGMKLMAALGVVLGIVLLLYALSRKNPGFLSSAKAGSIKVVETHYLGPKKALFLVEVRGEELLLGVCQERIELLSRLGRKNTSAFEETLLSALEPKR